MKAFTASVLAVISTAYPLRNCLYCKKADEDAHFLTSYSYCRQTEDCLANAWNYLDRPCQTGWKKGKFENIETCEAELATRECPSFVSTIEKAGTEQSRVWNLQSGTYCKISVDSADFVGRLKLDDVTDLGILDGKTKIGKVLSFDAGKSGDVTIYNAAKSGTVTFTITFSGASTLALSAIALASIPILSSF